MPELQFRPLTPERWADLEKLFGPRGATGGCWCMYFRLPGKQYSQNKGEINRRMLKGLVDSGEPPGILAYAGDEPVGWCSLAPRPEFARLENSRILKPVDERPVWSVVCFFVAKAHRRQGVTVRLLRAAVEYAASQGAGVVEGYPLDPPEGSVPDVFAYHGLLETFRQAGFVEVARRSPTRPIMRLEMMPGKGAAR